MSDFPFSGSARQDKTFATLRNAAREIVPLRVNQGAVEDVFELCCVHGFEVLLREQAEDTPRQDQLAPLADSREERQRLLDASRKFHTEGGFALKNDVFDGSLEALLGDLVDEVWKDAG